MKAKLDGRIVGSNFIDERNAIAGIGPITVDPSAQDKSVGRRLMLEVMKRCAEKNASGVRLVQAAFHNRSLSLYTKLGFDVREPLSCMQGPPISAKLPVRVTQPMTLMSVGLYNEPAGAFLPSILY